MHSARRSLRLHVRRQPTGASTAPLGKTAAVRICASFGAARSALAGGVLRDGEGGGDLGVVGERVAEAFGRRRQPGEHRVDDVCSSVFRCESSWRICSACTASERRELRLTCGRPRAAARAGGGGGGLCGGAVVALDLAGGAVLALDDVFSRSSNFLRSNRSSSCAPPPLAFSAVTSRLKSVDGVAPRRRRADCRCAPPPSGALQPPLA